MGKKVCRIIYVVINIILNIVLVILGFVPFIIAVSCTINEYPINGIRQSMADRIEAFIFMNVIILFLFGVNLILYKLMSKKPI